MAARPDDEVEAQGRGPARGRAGIEDDIVADRELDHVQADLAGEVEQGEIGVRPAPGEEIAVGAVLHEGKIPQGRGRFKSARRRAMIQA